MSIIYGVDFGVADALQIFSLDEGVPSKLVLDSKGEPKLDDNGEPVKSGIIPKSYLKLPSVKGGRTPAMEFAMVLEALLTGGSNDVKDRKTNEVKDRKTKEIQRVVVPAGDVVFESATIGSSGCEPEQIMDLLRKYPDRRIYTLTTRAVKNYRLDNGLEWRKIGRYADDGALTPEQVIRLKQREVHEEDAALLYAIAKAQPNRLYRWTGPSTPITRIHTSVRPMDKHLYRDERALDFIKLLPPFETLPDELKALLYGKGNPGPYNGALVMPFAMATTEPYLDAGPREERRRRYEKLIGLYDRGYPSFYRRAVNEWMTRVAKDANAAIKASLSKAEIQELRERRKELVARATELAKTGERLSGAEAEEKKGIEKSLNLKSGMSREDRKAALKVAQRQIRHFFHLTMEFQGR